MKIFTHPLDKFYINVNTNHLKKRGGGGVKLLDIGALNFSQWKKIRHTHPYIHHFGIDYVDPTETIPENYVFKKADLNIAPIPFGDDQFDIVIASHIIEHLNDPVNFFRECLRVLKPGGILYVEAPSEKSVKLSGMSFDYDQFYSLSLYDDPTHTHRPWTPQSFHRLARYFSCNPLKVGYIRSNVIRLLSPVLIPFARITRNGRLLEKVVWLTCGWAAYIFVKKDKSIKGAPPFHYYIPDRKRTKLQAGK